MPQLVPFYFLNQILSSNNNIISNYIYIVFSQDMSDMFGLILACFALVLIVFYIYYYDEGKWNNACPRCAEQGITVYVLPGKHCRRCGQPC